VFPEPGDVLQLPRNTPGPGFRLVCTCCSGNSFMRRPQTVPCLPLMSRTVPGRMLCRNEDHLNGGYGDPANSACTEL